VKCGTCSFYHWQVTTQCIFKTIITQCFKIGDKPGFVRPGHIYECLYNKKVDAVLLLKNNPQLILSLYCKNFRHWADYWLLQMYMN